MTSTTQITITNVVQSRGFAFAVVSDNGEQIFIPSHAASDIDGLAAGDSIAAVLVPNAKPQGASHRPTPWLAVKLIDSGNDEDKWEPFADDAQDQDCSNVSTPLDQQALDALRDVAFASASDVAAMIGADTQAVRNSLHRLWTSGRCARAMIHNRFGQQRASLVMYAMSASDFLEIE